MDSRTEVGLAKCVPCIPPATTVYLNVPLPMSGKNIRARHHLVDGNERLAYKLEGVTALALVQQSDMIYYAHGKRIDKRNK
ncbi:GL20285 [Drosophila persimilis]|uniref:GL20285 n=1 Tax=Drosophila persimilis TaxID=7234 RepID=B4GXI7_DROPE|nr:GL20285 [Drosophila persimilis]